MEESEKINKLTKMMSIGTASRQAMDILDMTLDKLSSNCDDRIFKKMNSGESVSYEDMMMSFAEKNSYNNIKLVLHKNISISKSAGETYKKIIEGDKNGTKRTVPGNYRGI